ncbi:hypothetical protein Mapa_016746 [Marchantia paleacea]|nr:hypothetical protein Mapa_016746 [Marchantia paleacea]
MVATKRSPQPEVNNAKEKRSGNTEAGSVFQEPLGGFIFVCNNETMGEDFERHLFGLPQRYHDSVKAIQPGLPLFLYNYTTRCLHGVFEASSDGGLNIEPDAWGENKESRKNGRQSVSRFPAQVRVRWREERPPLEEERFRPVLYHYDGPKFRLQLSESEAQELLKLFGASPVRKVVENVQEDNGGEWEKVKTKSKASRSFRAPPTKGSTSPNATTGRRRGSAQNGTSGNGIGNGGGNVLLSNISNSMHEAVSRGRDRDNRVDNSQRWRSDSDSWSGSSSAGTATSSWGSHEDERPKKGSRDNGWVAEGNGVGGEGHDCVDGVASSKSYTQVNGSYDSDNKVEIRFIVDSNESNVSSSSLSAEARAAAAARSGFVSYSAALKSGMLAAAAAAAENGCSDGNSSVVPEIGNSTQSSVSSRSSRVSSSNATAAGCVTTSSPRANSKGDLSVERIEADKEGISPVVPFFVLNIGSYCEAAVSGNQVKVGQPSSVEKGGSESRAEHGSNRGEAEGKKVEKMQPWGKPAIVKAANLAEVLSGSQSIVVDNHVAGSKDTSDLTATAKKSAKEGLRNGLSDGENGENDVHHRFGNFEVKEVPMKPLETVVRKNVWQGNEGAVLRLLHDPDPAVNSGSVNGGTNGHKLEPELYRGKHDRVKSPQPHVQHPNVHPSMERVVHVQSPPLDGQLAQWPDQSSSPSGSVPTHVPYSKGSQQQGPLFQQNRSGHESRRQQFDNHKHDKLQEDRTHFRKQHIHPQEHSQHPTPMMHAQQRQLGQGLMPLRIPTPPPGMQQIHHHAILSPAPLYRDRSRGRNGSGNSENVNGLAYRPVSRNMIDGEMGLQSPIGPNGWTLQTPVLLPYVSHITGNFSFSIPPPQTLGNAEALHAEILEFAQASRPSAETRVHAEAAVECVRDGVKRLWPEADVEVFGSFATGLCLQHSDVDVVVVDAPTPPDTPEIAALSGARLLCPLIRALSASLKDYEWCEGINTIETASMPVIKLRCRPVKANGFSSEPPVAIDVTIGGRRSENFAGVIQGNPRHEAKANKPLNHAFELARNAHNGAAAREFVIEKLRQFPALAPLVLLMKSFLQQRGLNDVYSGGLGSFALTLMLVFYLERVPISCGVPQDLPPPLIPIKSPSSANLEASALSVDTSRSSSGVAESVASSDDDSSDSSVLTTTSVSSLASLEVPSIQGSSCGGDEVASQAGPSTGELLLRRAGGMVEELLASMQSVSSPNLGTLLIGFLHVFGQEIDFSRVRLVLKGKNGNPGGLFCHDKMARTLPLWIDDPLRPDAIIGAGSFNIWQVQASMRDMLYSITRPLSVPGTPVPGTPVEIADRNGKGPGRRRPLPLLDQIFFMNVSSPVP